jgi:hypothetical protein
VPHGSPTTMSDDVAGSSCASIPGRTVRDPGLIE